MTTTPELIDALAADAAPVRRLRPPLARAALWLAMAGLVLALLVGLLGTRPDLGVRLREPGFALALAGALLTGGLAAVAAFHLSLPDRSRRWLLLPLPGIGLWAATIGYGCLFGWVAIGPDDLRAGAVLECFRTLLLVTLPLAAALLAMLRHAARLRPASVAATGGLAVAGVAAATLALVHPLDASLMVLVWNLGVAALLAALGGALGRRLLARVAPRATAR